MLERAGSYPDTRSIEAYPKPLVPRAVVERTLADNKVGLIDLLYDYECPPEESAELELLFEEIPVQIQEIEHPAIVNLIDELSILLQVAIETPDERLWEFEQRHWKRILEITEQVDNLAGEPYDHWDELQAIPEFE